VQADNDIKQDKPRRQIASCQLPIADFLGCWSFEVFSKLAIGAWQLPTSFVEFILDRSTFILFLGKRFTGDSILTFNPPAKVNKLTPLRTEGTKRIFFPLGRRTARWTFHLEATTAGYIPLKSCRTFNQYSSFDECDRTFAAHGIQAHGDAFTS